MGSREIVEDMKKEISPLASTIRYTAGETELICHGFLKVEVVCQAVR